MNAEYCIKWYVELYHRHRRSWRRAQPCPSLKYTYEYVKLYVYIHTYTYIHIYIYVEDLIKYALIYLWTCIVICIYIHIHIYICWRLYSQLNLLAVEDILFLAKLWDIPIDMYIFLDACMLVLCMHTCVVSNVYTHCIYVHTSISYTYVWRYVHVCAFMYICTCVRMHAFGACTIYML